MNNMATRYIGLCICCIRKIKVRDNLLVAHGYRRPGYGYIVGECFGYNKEPHEISSTTAKEYLNHIQIDLKRTNEALEIAVANLKKVEDEYKEAYTDADPLKFKLRNDLQDEIRTISRNIYFLESKAKFYNEEIKRIVNEIKIWQPKPLLTFDEDVKIKSAQKKQNAIDRNLKKLDKFNVKIKRFQERIDSAYRRENKDALKNIYESIHYNLFSVRHPLLLTKDDCIKQVDRDKVWEELGYMKDGKYLSLKEIRGW